MEAPNGKSARLASVVVTLIEVTPTTEEKVMVLFGPSNA